MPTLNLTVPQAGITLSVSSLSFAISGFQGPPGGGGGGGISSVSGANSVSATTASGAVTVQLVNDVATPTNGQFYGYQSGARGFFFVPYGSLSGVPSSFAPSAHQATHRRGGSDPLVSASGDAAATDLVLGSDSRLTNSRTPTAHALTHESGGSDAIPIDTLAAPTDITALNVSTAAHGLMPKATGSATTFYGSDNTQKAVPYASLSGTPSTFTPSAHQSTHITGGSDVIPAFTATASGLAPLSGGGTANFLRADGTWSAPSGSGVPATDVQIFTTPGAFTWTKPAGTPQVVEIICIGGGGGGGSGGYAAAATAVGGGGGGSGGGYSRVTVSASLLGATVNGNVGAGGSGGAAITVSGTPGSAGSAYASATNDSSFGTSPNFLCYAAGGKPGGGGPISTAGGSAGGISSAAEFVGVVGGAGSANGGGAGGGGSQSGNNSSTGGAGGAGGGGGFSTGNVEVVGGSGSVWPMRQGGQGAGAPGGAHSNGGSGLSSPAHLPGAGGGGGGSSNTASTSGGNGGNGGNYGGAGGGGGAGNANLNAVGSGAGGNGANGVVVVRTYF